MRGHRTVMMRRRPGFLEGFHSPSKVETARVASRAAWVAMFDDVWPAIEAGVRVSLEKDIPMALVKAVVEHMVVEHFKEHAGRITTIACDQM